MLEPQIIPKSTAAAAYNQENKRPLLQRLFSSNKAQKKTTSH